LCKGNPQQWSSSNGQAFETDEGKRKFNYTLGSPSTGPTVGSGAKQAVLKGIGQCEYFATQAYAALKVGGKKGSVPRVDKISTPGHNWVLVNYSPKDNSSDKWVAVDYWLLALGVPRDKCICSLEDFVDEFGDDFNLTEFTTVETFNPDNQD
jgi:hypothetical protein